MKNICAFRNALRTDFQIRLANPEFMKFTEKMKFFIFISLLFPIFANSLPASSVPKVFLEYWNEDLDLQYSNNCYNYAANRVTNSYAQPGEASDKMYVELSCEDLHKATSSDLGLTPTDPFPYEKKEGETLLALVVAPRYDFHWYRRDDNGLWSHKMGGTPATTLDNSGQEITSPETADRGRYTDFCGYFRIKNFPTEEHEQNGGYVRIGNMTELPEVSEVRVLLYSGRRNPSYELRELLKHESLRSAFSKIKSELDGLRKNSAQPNQEPPRFHLGYQGVQVFDREGLISEDGSLIHFKNGKAFIHMSQSREVIAFESDVLKTLEQQLLEFFGVAAN